MRPGFTNELMKEKCGHCGNLLGTGDPYLVENFRLPENVCGVDTDDIIKEWCDGRWVGPFYYHVYCVMDQIGKLVNCREEMRERYEQIRQIVMSGKIYSGSAD